MRSYKTLFYALIILACGCEDDDTTPAEPLIQTVSMVRNNVYCGGCEFAYDSVGLHYEYDQNRRIKIISRKTFYYYKGFDVLHLEDVVTDTINFAYLPNEIVMTMSLTASWFNGSNPSQTYRFKFNNNEYKHPYEVEITYHRSGATNTISFNYNQDNYLTEGFYSEYVGSVGYDIVDQNIHDSHYFWGYADHLSPLNQVCGFEFFQYDNREGWEAPPGPNPIMFPIKMFERSKNLLNTYYTYQFNQDGTLARMDYETAQNGQHWIVLLEYK